MLNRVRTAVVVGCLVFVPAAGAHAGWRAISPHRVAASTSCPAGVPVQTLTVVNQAHARVAALAAVERATVSQSVQLRAWWGTPCVRFGAGGWVVTLTSGCTTSGGATTCQLGGWHSGPQSAHLATAQPTIDVQTGALPYTLWARAFTHEVVETLVNPTPTRRWTLHGATGLLEVADPCESVTYPLDGVPVSDFALPAFFAGSLVGPWDQARALTRGMS